jgi:FG-GAP-like repeat
VSRRPLPPGRLACLPLLLTAALAAAAADEEPFEAFTARVEGRPLELVALSWSGSCASRASEWLVISVSGAAPDERHRASFVGCGRPGSPETAVRHSFAIPAGVVAYDVADVDPSPGVELLLLTSRALEVRSTPEGTLLRQLALPPSAPLPARTRELSRMILVDAWNGDGRPAALVPDRDGAALLAFDGSPPRRIALPLVAEYETTSRGPPARDTLVEAHIVWPALTLGDDDGDGRPDLFARSRYAIWIYHNGPSGLPEAPTRRLALRPFSAEEELRPETTAFRHLVGDLNGDSAMDLVLDSGAGTLLHSRHTTAVHLNPGSGVRLDSAPDLELPLPGAIAEVWLRDLDGDGRVELIRGSLEFGLLQAIRMLLTRSVRFELEVFTLAPGPSLRRSWADQISLELDFQSGRVADLLPSAEGDWNGDGRMDLLYGAGGGRLGIRLGTLSEAGPGFGPRVADQALPTSARLAVADFDGDGLDDLALYDPRDEEGRIYLLRNRGLLPGTRARLSPVP